MVFIPNLRFQIEQALLVGEPFGHVTSKPNGLPALDALPRDVQQKLDGLVIVDARFSTDHVVQEFHAVRFSILVERPRIRN